MATATAGTPKGRGGGTGTLAGRTGVAVQNSFLLLTRLLDALALPLFDEEGNDVALRHKTVIELGCSMALSSTAATKLGACAIIVVRHAADGNPDAVELARRNIDRNGVGDVVMATELHWGLLGANDYYNTADVKIGSDLTYISESWKVLVEMLSAIFKPGGIIIYSTLGHLGFKVISELNGSLLWQRAKAYGSSRRRMNDGPFGSMVGGLRRSLFIGFLCNCQGGGCYC